MTSQKSNFLTLLNPFPEISRNSNASFWQVKSYTRVSFWEIFRNSMILSKTTESVLQGSGAISWSFQHFGNCFYIVGRLFFMVLNVFLVIKTAVVICKSSKSMFSLVSSSVLYTDFIILHFFRLLEKYEKCLENPHNYL